MKILPGGLETRIGSRLKRRCTRGTRKKEMLKLERQIENFLGPDYSDLKNSIPHAKATFYQRALNKRGTKSEKTVVACLLALGVEDFYPNKLLLNRYYGDIVFDEGIVIEIDGSWHDREGAKERDSKKTYWLERFGYKVYRFGFRSENDAEIIAQEIFKIVGKRTMPHAGAYRNTCWPPKLGRVHAKPKKAAIPTRGAFPTFMSERDRTDMINQWLKKLKAG